MKLNPYLNYGGNCADAFRFYEKHLGGKITAMMTFDQAPDQQNIPANIRKGIMYSRMTIGETKLWAATRLRIGFSRCAASIFL
jgi:PhnB protein